MFKRTVTEADLARLRREVEEADRRYNDALTGVDRSLLRVPAAPSPLPPPDATRMAELNEAWRTVPEDPSSGLTGWRRRLGGFVWRLLGPSLQRQQAFNAALVDQLNRAQANEQAARAKADALVAGLGEQLAAVALGQSTLLAYLQQLTPYIDTRDREVAGLMRRINEDVAEVTYHLDHRTAGLSAAVSGLADEMLKRFESAAAGQRRDRAEALAAADACRSQTAELQTRLALVQQASFSMRRELERLLAAGGAHVDAGQTEPAAPDRQGAEAGAAPAVTRSRSLDSYKYVGFEDAFRGSPEEIRRRLSNYLPLFDGRRDVLDVGCGRGEFLDLLRERGIAGRGVDLNHEMVAVCRERGLDVVEGDGVAYLSSLGDGSLGGLFAAQVVEHLQPDSLMALLDAAYAKLTPGSPIVLETINSACWFAFFESYVRDITHVRPLHPDTLRYLLQAGGFERVEVRYSAPYPAHQKLQRMVVPAAVRQAHDLDVVATLAETHNDNVERLNALLFTHLDFAAVGWRA